MNESDIVTCAYRTFGTAEFNTADVGLSAELRALILHALARSEWSANAAAVFLIRLRNRPSGGLVLRAIHGGTRKAFFVERVSECEFPEGV